MDRDKKGNSTCNKEARHERTGKRNSEETRLKRTYRDINKLTKTIFKRRSIFAKTSTTRARPRVYLRPYVPRRKNYCPLLLSGSWQSRFTRATSHRLFPTDSMLAARTLVRPDARARACSQLLFLHPTWTRSPRSEPAAVKLRWHKNGSRSSLGRRTSTL